MNAISPLRVLIVASEFGRMAETGGLSQAAHGLAQGLARRGHHISVALPKHAGTLEYCVERARSVRHAGRFPVPFGGTSVAAEAFRATFRVSRSGPSKIHAIMVDDQERSRFSRRQGLYGQKDDADRYLFFDRAVRAMLDTNGRYADFKPDVIIANDWQAGFLPLFFRYGIFRRPIATVLTIHNATYGFQMSFPMDRFEAATGLLGSEHPWLYSPEGIEFHHRIDALKAGIVMADRVVTVSPQYARELLAETTPEPHKYGGILRAHSRKFSGALNGLPADFGPKKAFRDEIIPFSYHADDLSGKARNKEAFRRKHGLALDDSMLVAISGRLDQQKGTDVVLQMAERLLAAGIQIAIVGSGFDRYPDERLEDLRARFPQSYVFLKYEDAGIGTDEETFLMAAADTYLMPSRFEPCGLGQMKAQKMGCLPIANATGGLMDTILNGETGFLFQGVTTEVVEQAVLDVYRLYRENPVQFQTMAARAMQLEYSWDRVAARWESDILIPAVGEVLREAA